MLLYINGLELEVVISEKMRNFQTNKETFRGDETKRVVVHFYNLRLFFFYLLATLV